MSSTRSSLVNGKTVFLRKTVDFLLSQSERINQKVLEDKTELQHAQETLTHNQEALEILQAVAQQVQQQAHEKISSVVSKCLNAVFDHPYEFTILFEQKRNKTEARMIFKRDGKEFDPMSASGGGVVDVAAFALRIACLVLTQPQARRLVVLDEPLKFVSKDLRERVGEMILKLAEELDMQWIIVTHDDEFQIGKIVHIRSH